MSTVSTITRKLVKPKLTNVPAPFNSAGPLCTPSPAVKPDKPAQAQDLQKSGPGARAGSDLLLDIPVLTGERKGKQTSLSARYILGIIIAKVGYGRWGYLAEETIVREARCGLWPVKNAKKQLEDAGLLDVNRRGKCHRYHIPEWVKHLAKIWVKPGMVRDDGLSIPQAVWVSLVKFRQGDNYATWLTHQAAAEILGVSYHSIARVAAWSAALGYVQKRHRPWRRSSKNEYCLTCLGREATGVFEPKSARPNARALGQTNKVRDLVYANSVRNGSFRAQFGLSNDPKRDREVHRLLRSIGTADSVARPMAFEQRYLLADVKQTLVNGALQGDDYYRRMWRLSLPALRFNLAGYVIRTLTGAHREGHGVPPSKLARAAEARRQGGARAAAGGGVTDSSFEQCKQEQIRRLFMTPAKPYTPQELAKLAEERRFRDKSVEDQLLRAVTAAARSRSWQYRKYANLGQKLGFSLDKVS
ncbi:hypothetical protein ES708_18244 [subsurface metagenome]